MRHLALTTVALLGLAALAGAASYLALAEGLGGFAGLLALAGLAVAAALAPHLRGARGERPADNLATLALVASHSRTAVLISDATGRTEWLNEPFTQLTGYTLADLRGRRPGDLLRGPGTDPGAARAFDEALAAGAPASGELLNYHKDGRSFWVELSVTPVCDAAGRLTRCIAVQSDITARVLAEAGLREALALNQAVLDGAGHLIIAVGADGLITRVNPAVERALGYRAEELIGRVSPSIFQDPEEIERCARQLRVEQADHAAHAAEPPGWWAWAGLSDEHEATFIRKDGSRFPVQLAVSPLRDAAGTVYGYVGIANDITERQAVDRLRRDLVATVSHELRTPLTAIRGALGLLAASVADGLPPRAQAMIDIAQGNSERLMRLVSDILDMERIETGKMPFEPRPLPLVPLLAQAVAASEPFAAELGVRLALDPDSAPALVSADADRLTQVITNLLSNAVRFSPPGGTVAFGVERLAGQVRITVADRGPGVPEQFRPYIFQKFAQAEEQGGRSGGSGLGLSIARSIVEQHAGQIGFADRPGGGSVFFVDLPALDDMAQAGSRVLVVDDDPQVAEALAAMLEHAGYHVDCADSVGAARARLAAEHYCGVTLDLHLPGEGVVSLVRQLRAAPAASATAIVIVSAWADQGRELLSGDMAGVADWIGKPVDYTRLLGALGGRPPPHQAPLALGDRARAERSDALSP